MRARVTPGSLAPLTEGNGLRSDSRLMVDKITTVSKGKLGVQIGRLDREDLIRLNRAIMVFLGLA